MQLDLMAQNPHKLLSKDMIHKQFQPVDKELVNKTKMYGVDIPLPL